MRIKLNSPAAPLNTNGLGAGVQIIYNSGNAGTQTVTLNLTNATEVNISDIKDPWFTLSIQLPYWTVYSDAGQQWPDPPTSTISFGKFELSGSPADGSAFQAVTNQLNITGLGSYPNYVQVVYALDIALGSSNITYGGFIRDITGASSVDFDRFDYLHDAAQRAGGSQPPWTGYHAGPAPNLPPKAIIVAPFTPGSGFKLDWLVSPDAAPASTTTGTAADDGLILHEISATNTAAFFHLTVTNTGTIVYP